MTFPLWWNKPKPCSRASSRQQVLLTPGLTPPHRPCGPEPVDSPPGAIAVARRTEALARVHAEPRIAIRKVARRLATIPHDTIRTPNMADAKTRRWLSAPLPELLIMQSSIMAVELTLARKRQKWHSMRILL